MKLGKSIDELALGDTISDTRTFTTEDVVEFANQSGDHNPMHLDEEYASHTHFKHRIVHGHLVASMFSKMLGTEMPGLGTIYFKQDLKYIAPVYLNDVINYEVTIVEMDTQRNRVKCDTNAYNQDGQIVIKGSAVVLPPKKN